MHLSFYADTGYMYISRVVAIIDRLPGKISNDMFEIYHFS